MTKRILTLLALPLLIITLATTTLPSSVSAVNAADWKPGRIIDDSLFANANDMSVTDIQNFLNTKVPNCDTWGTQPASDWGRPNMSHAQYAASRGWPGPPYVCLRNYYEVPKTDPGPGIPANSFQNGGNPPVGSISAAQMIFNAAQRYSINPKALLVTIQKESIGPLTTDNWPMEKQYTYAMGAYCPDSGPGGSANCDANYAGFSIQIAESARLMRYYLNNMQQPWWTYKKPFQNNNILWNVAQTGCGAGNVYIETKATAALYTYTPYQPNQAALNNMYGTGDGCSAYGNRNFWRIWSDWFGSPNYSPPTCNSWITEVRCVWQLAGQGDSNFLTISEAERDNAVSLSRYSYTATPFNAFTKQIEGTIPVYRLRLSSEHLYTTSTTERDSLLQTSGTSYEGIAFYVYPPSQATNTSYQVYRLANSLGHVLVSSSSQRDTLISQGYRYEGIAFNAPSAYALLPDPPLGKTNVYRLNGPKEHMYTTNLQERDALLVSGWSNENTLVQASQTPTSLPVYRIANSTFHLFTTSASERNQLLGSGWRDEGISWYMDESMPFIYRLAMPSGAHFFTADQNEAVNNAENNNAIFEGVMSGNGTSGGARPIFRFYNGVYHFFTADFNESMGIALTNWKYEGIGWNSSQANSSPVYRMYNIAGARHHYTGNPVERDFLVRNGWRDEGIAWYSSPATYPAVYRVYNLTTSRHFYTGNPVERDFLVRNGWRDEGIAWYQQ